MPLLDYGCENCQHLLEDVLQKTSDEELKECPVCHKQTLVKLAPINNFKISGYSYSNSYSNK